MQRVALCAALVCLVRCAAGAQPAPAPALAQDAFADVPRGHWAYQALHTLRKYGIVEGYPDGTFGGGRELTRYEFAQALWRAVNFLRNSGALRGAPGMRGDRGQRGREGPAGLPGKAGELARGGAQVAGPRGAEGEPGREGPRGAQGEAGSAAGTISRAELRAIVEDVLAGERWVAPEEAQRALRRLLEEFEPEIFRLADEADELRLRLDDLDRRVRYLESTQPEIAGRIQYDFAVDGKTLATYFEPSVRIRRPLYELAYYTYVGRECAGRVLSGRAAALSEQGRPLRENALAAPIAVAVPYESHVTVDVEKWLKRFTFRARFGRQCVGFGQGLVFDNRAWPIVGLRVQEMREDPRWVYFIGNLGNGDFVMVSHNVRQMGKLRVGTTTVQSGLGKEEIYGLDVETKVAGRAVCAEVGFRHRDQSGAYPEDAGWAAVVRANVVSRPRFTLRLSYGFARPGFASRTGYDARDLTLSLLTPESRIYSARQTTDWYRWLEAPLKLAPDSRVFSAEAEWRVRGHCLRVQYVRRAVYSTGQRLPDLVAVSSSFRLLHGVDVDVLGAAALGAGPGAGEAIVRARVQYDF